MYTKKCVYTGSEYLQIVRLNKKSGISQGKDRLSLVECLKKYEKHLKQKTDTMKSLYSSLTLVRTPMLDGECYTS